VGLEFEPTMMLSDIAAGERAGETESFRALVQACRSGFSGDGYAVIGW
jgi:hypothetical protein